MYVYHGFPWIKFINFEEKGSINVLNVFSSMRNISDIEKRLNYRTIDVKDNDKVTVIL